MKKIATTACYVLFLSCASQRQINLPAAPSYPEVSSSPELGYKYCGDLETVASKKTWKQSGLGSSMLLTALLAPVGTALAAKPIDFNPDDDADATNDIGAIEQSFGPVLILLAGASLAGAGSNYFYKKSAATGILIADANEGNAKDTGIKAYQACVTAAASFERERARQLGLVTGKEKAPSPPTPPPNTPGTRPVAPATSPASRPAQ